MTIMQTAWLIYAVCGFGFCLATWWLFLWAWRFVRYSAVVTTMTLVFTPYAIDPQTMQMAPAIFTLVFNGVSLGLVAVLPLIKLMVGIWLIGIILVALFVVLTRKSSRGYSEPSYHRVADDRGRSGAGRAQHARSSGNRDSRSARDRSAASGGQKRGKQKPTAPRKEYFPMDNLSREERQARDEMLHEDMPMRAIRD